MHLSEPSTQVKDVAARLLSSKVAGGRGGGWKGPDAERWRVGRNAGMLMFSGAVALHAIRFDFATGDVFKPNSKSSGTLAF